MKAARQFGGQHGAELVVCGVEAYNALGFSAYQTWAFRRAELTCFLASPFRLASGERATMAAIASLSPTAYGLPRMVPALVSALDPLLAQLRAPALARARFACALCLPPRTGDVLDRRSVAEGRELERTVHLRFAEAGLPSPTLQTFALGHAALGRALLWAAQELDQAETDAVIVGAVDTYYDPMVMEALIDARRIFASDNIDAFIPGEGAAFLLLTQRRRVHSLGWPVLARLSGVSVGEEPCSMLVDVPCLGSGLSRTITPLTDRLSKEGRPVDLWLSDATNETYRTHELQLALPRVLDLSKGKEPRLEFPAYALGDLGAAAMPTAAALAIQGFARAESDARTCVLLGSSVGEERGAVLLEESR